ncbi:YdaU family protein [Xylella fastidiosa subsp. pauca]|uniref:YdaU family protein n=1 Tax=Xylella fastidiosa TaxID=2371 RepID=UPI00249F4342|nr:YdaU family protein [Xylella fastidiosa]WGZ31219.1 YdaU family protein [Xylella fastidiosa subsp. pauca]
MNYYERHIGDYARDTGYLSVLEHGIYCLLLDRYYATEQPIPANKAHRIARAYSKKEKSAVDVVLDEFFLLQDDGWHNKRCDEEIARFHAKAAAQQENGKKGGRPRNSAHHDSQTQTQQKPADFDLDNPNETQSKANTNPNETQIEPNQKPTRPQTPDPIISSSLRSEESLVFAEDGNATGCTGKPKRSPHGSRLPDDWAPSEVDVLYATQQGVDGRYEAEKFRDYWRSVAGAKGRKQDWEATWRNWIRRAAEDKTSSMKHGYQRHEYNSKPMRLSPAERSRVFHRPFDLRDGVLQ